MRKGSNPPVEADHAGLAARPARRGWEWFGCFATWAWAYSLVNSFEPVVTGNGAIMPLLVMLLAASVVATVLGCGSDPKKLSHTAVLATPMGLVATAAMALLPVPAYLLFYAISFLCLGPPLVRRMYGLLQVYDLPGNARVIMLVIPAVFVFHAAWVELPASFEAKFAILAVVGAGSLWRVRSVSLWRVSDPSSNAPEPKPRSASRIMLLAGYFAIFATADFAYQVLITAVAAKLDAPHPIPWLASMIVSGVVVAIGGIVTGSDAGRGWLVIAIAATIAGLAAPLVADMDDFDFGFVQLFTYSVGAGTALMVLLGFLPTISPSRRLESLFASVGAVWIAVRGSIVILLQDHVSFMRQGNGGPPGWLFVGALVVTVAGLVISFVLLSRTATIDLIAAVMALVAVPPKQRPSVESVVSELGQADRRMVSLLAGGQSRAEIARELAMPVAQINERIASIRRSLAGHRGEALAQLASQHGLTSREVEMVEDICDSKPNSQIASERFITERTVKFHIGNALTKLGVSNRREIREMVERASETRQ